jgi:ribosomal protein L23
MRIEQVILGDVSTEKAERLKTRGVYLLRIHPQATKVDVLHALRRSFGVEPRAVRILHVRPKRRIAGRGRVIQKRDPSKRALVTLAPKSKVLDLTAFQTS